MDIMGAKLVAIVRQFPFTPKTFPLNKKKVRPIRERDRFLIVVFVILSHLGLTQRGIHPSAKQDWAFSSPWDKARGLPRKLQLLLEPVG